MHLLELTLTTPEANLAFDESLFRALEEAAGRGDDPRRWERIRLWESPRPCVVLGRAGRLEREVDLAACARDGVPVLRRASGGGAVVLGPGCLCFSVLLCYDGDPSLRDVAASYDAILGRVASALGVDGLELRETTDLALGGRKVSGNAQLRGRHGLLHQGTLLYALDPRLVSRLLREPERQPPYRARRPHHEFVGNLSLPPRLLRSRVAQAWLGPGVLIRRSRRFSKDRPGL